jgi:hypothetical protein
MTENIAACFKCCQRRGDAINLDVKMPGPSRNIREDAHRDAPSRDAGKRTL